MNVVNAQVAVTWLLDRLQHNTRHTSMQRTHAQDADRRVKLVFECWTVKLQRKLYGTTLREIQRANYHKKYKKMS